MSAGQTRRVQRPKMAKTDRVYPDWLIEAFDVPRETRERIELVLSCLDDWRTKLNLIGPSEWDHVWARHVLDSLQLLPIIPSGPVLDLGSGAGFPGLLIAASRESGPDNQVTLVESVAKKCAFLNAAISAANLNARVLNARAESIEPFPVGSVTARALAPLPKLLAYVQPWLSNGAIGVFPKGKSWQEELPEAKKTWTFASQTIPSHTSDDGVILRISELKRA